MCETCRILVARNETLEAKVADLERHVFNHEWQAPRELRLSPAEEAMTRLMVKTGDRPASKEFLWEATRFAAHSARLDVDPKTIDTLMCKLRAKVRPHGLDIETVWGRGYRLAPASRTRLLHWNTQTEQAA